jgi:hypothetical protein
MSILSAIFDRVINLDGQSAADGPTYNSRNIPPIWPVIRPLSVSHRDFLYVALTIPHGDRSDNRAAPVASVI